MLLRVLPTRPASSPRRGAEPAGPRPTDGAILSSMAVNRDSENPGLAIGAALKDARQRVGMDVKEAEDRTKIRARYLRALEAEDWEALPGNAYVRGFLRTYGQILGLDGEMLADEFRRNYDQPLGVGGPAAEPLLRERSRGGRRSSSRGPLIAVVAVAIVALLVLIGLLSGGDDDSEPAGGGGRQDRGAGNGKGNGKGGNGDGGGKSKQKGGSDRKPVDISIEPLSGLTVCVVGGSDTALIDSQNLPEGAVSEFSDEKKYRIDFLSPGSLRVEAGDARQRIDSDGETSVQVDSNGIREISYAGPDCP